jgi:hypothetical protein
MDYRKTELRRIFKLKEINSKRKTGENLLVGNFTICTLYEISKR